MNEKLPFNEALLQTFNFLTVMQPTMEGTFSADDCLAVKRTCQILAVILLEQAAQEEDPNKHWEDMVTKCT